MLVARAVDGLKPEDVTIVNQDGQVLLPPAGGDANAPDPLNLTQQQLAAKQRYETSVQSSIQSMLDQTLGARRAVARVSTKMDFDATTTETKTYAPAGTVLSTQSKRESYNGTQPRAAIGVPGTTTNIPTYQAQQQGSGGRYNKSETTTNYDISETNAKHIGAPGKVLATSVAVVLNAAGAGGSGYQITPAMRQQIQNLVVAAAGLNLANGDQVSVETIPFNPTVTAIPAAAAANAGTVLGVPAWVLALALGIVAICALGLLRTRRRGIKAMLGLPAFDTSLGGELPSFEDPPMLNVPPGVASPSRSQDDVTREQMVEYVTTVAKESPDSIAKLVKLWLAE